MSEDLQRAEAKGEPAVFRGAVATWPALRRWAGRDGLSHLASVAGGAPVQVMLSATRHFYGNIDSHQPAECTLSDVLAAAERHLAAAAVPATADGGGGGGATEGDESVGATGADAEGGNGSGSGGGGVAPNMYLAQQPLDGPGLEALLPDVPVPGLLGRRQLDATNLWISPCASRSSLHYDPYQNLLAVVAGSKTVTLISPEATPALYPKSPLGEASNHSAVNFGTPDSAAHPLYRLAQPQALRVRLGPGDALFIPEGWWHQVDSAAATVAVNFWWSSAVSAGLRALPHLHHYYLRLLQSSVVAQATKSLLDGLSQDAAPEAADAAAGTAVSGHGPPKKRVRTQADGGSSAGGLSTVDDWAAAALEEFATQGKEETAAAAAALAAAVAEDPVQQDESNGGGTGGSGGGAALCGGAWHAAAQASNRSIARAAVMLARPGSAALGSGGTATEVRAAGKAAAAAAAADEGPADDPLGLRNPVTLVLAALPPLALANALHNLATRSPAAARDLLTRRLPPAGAALLTEKLEAAEAALGAGDNGSGGGGGSGRGSAEDRRCPPGGARVEGGAAAAAAGRASSVAAPGEAAAAQGGGSDDRAAGGQRQQRPSASGGLTAGSMREVYAALYGPEVGADPEEILARLLGGKMAVASTVAAAVLPAGGDAAAG